jgi:uncharacterized membrane protein YdfJ with MMPL/SSD domain
VKGQPGKGQHWVRLLPLALLIVLGLAGLRGAVGTPRWDGPLHRDGLAVGLALEAVFAVLTVLTLRRHRSAHQDLVAHKLRATLFTALGVGAAIVAVVTLLGLNLHLFDRRGKPLPPRPPLPTRSQGTPRPAHQAASTPFHFPLAALLYTLLVLLLLAAIAVSIWWARRLRPAVPARDDALIVEDSEDLREAVESGRSALRTVDDARAAIIACYLAMEQSLAERGTARSLADTPDELLARARARGVVRGTAAARLTALFYEARFSSHPLGPAQRDAAEKALDDLAAALAQLRPESAGASS